ncbi:AAA family ATPase [Spirochaetota bacterium]
MGNLIAVAGKGGTGKSTISALIIRSLLKNNKTPVLAIDADPNSNLPESIGIDIENSIGSVLSDFIRNKGEIPQGMTKQAFLEFKFHQILKEGKDLDMMVMGCPEGPGCYCAANSMLKGYYEDLSKNYKYVVVDNEAGMEHLSRKTTSEIDYLLFVSNYSLKALKTIERLSDMIDELRLNVGKRYLIVNQTPNEMEQSFVDEINRIEIPYLGNIVKDDLIEEYDVKGVPLTELPDSSKAVESIEKMLKNIIE